MAGLTSGLINTVSVQAGEFILDMLQDLRVLSDGQTPSAGDYTDCIRKMNFELKRMPTRAILLWTRDTMQITLQPNKTFYSVGPTGSGADIINYRPLRCFDGTYVRTTISGQSQDTTLRMLSRVEYQGIASKSVPGVVNSWYYDPQMTFILGPAVAYDPTLSTGVFYFYVTPQDSTYTAYVQTQRPLQEIDDQDAVLDIDMSCYSMVAAIFKWAVCDKYQVPPYRRKEVKDEAKEAWEEFSQWAGTELVPITFIPDPMSIGPAPKF